MNDYSKAITVSLLNEYIKSLIENSDTLKSLYVKGEISNFKNHYGTGHFYFSLKDESSVIKAVMFRSSASKLQFVPENGMKVILHGRVSVFTRDGQYQIYADEMEPDGVGSLYIAYEQLKRKLEDEGLFDISRKKAIPKIPSSIGVITSATGAAVRDIINVTGRRFPFASVTVYPALVQGEGAVQSLINGLNYFNGNDCADVIIIGRGGGSIEDLWAFNSELLARTISASHIPVISAVGHETDFTICDFVSDVRAPTPSAAAEIAVPDTNELKNKIENIVRRESAILNQRIASAKASVERISKTKVLSSPTVQIDDRRMSLSYLNEKIHTITESKISEAKSGVAVMSGKLSALDPLAVISRGYGAVYDDENIISSTDVLNIGQRVTVKLSDGQFDAEVKEIRKNKATV